MQRVLKRGEMPQTIPADAWPGPHLRASLQFRVVVPIRSYADIWYLQNQSGAPTTALLPELPEHAAWR